MDSGNSGSLQSSSGGGADEEYDSRGGSVTGAVSTGADSFNSLLHSVSSAAAAATSPFFLDTLSYLANFSRPPPPPQPPPPSSSRSFRQSPAELIYTSSVTATPPFTAPQSISRASQQAEVAPPQPPVAQPLLPRGSKKRTRASRRAPTTVLTTDTTNFRAMVQEFTGVPSPPFSSADGHSSFPRSRLDLFSSSGGATASPPYLLRPFPHKQPYNNTSINATSLSIPSSSTANMNSKFQNARTQQKPSNNYQLSPDLIAMQAQNPSNNIINTSFQSLLQSMPPPQLAGYSSEQLPVPSTAADFRVQPLSDFPDGCSGGVTRWPRSEDYRSRRPLAVHATEKGSDGGEAAAVQARSEGMESWVCSSD